MPLMIATGYKRMRLLAELCLLDRNSLLGHEQKKPGGAKVVEERRWAAETAPALTPAEAELAESNVVHPC